MFLNDCIFVGLRLFSIFVHFSEAYFVHGVEICKKYINFRLTLKDFKSDKGKINIYLIIYLFSYFASYDFFTFFTRRIIFVLTHSVAFLVNCSIAVINGLRIEALM